MKNCCYVLAGSNCILPYAKSHITSPCSYLGFPGWEYSSLSICWCSVIFADEKVKANCQEAKVLEERKLDQDAPGLQRAMCLPNNVHLRDKLQCLHMPGGVLGIRENTVNKRGKTQPISRKEKCERDDKSGFVKPWTVNQSWLALFL